MGTERSERRSGTTPAEVCIVGAGSSGLVSAKVLGEHGVPFDCYEMGSAPGGNWRIDNDNGRAAAYESLHIDTSKDRMAFSDFPMPESYPNYPHHSQVLAYFEAYARRFDLEAKITFRTRVEEVRPAGGGGWEVTVAPRDGGARETRLYRAVVVANGHHWHPNLPDLPGTFDGPTLHSRQYRSARGWEGERVVVLGIGNSGADIACDCAEVAERTILSARRSVHVIPRFILGRPTDKWATPFSSRLPLPVQRLLYGILLRLARGRQSRYGAPEPETDLFSEHPTLSTDLLPLVASGRVVMKPRIEELRGDRILFADGSEEPVDRLIHATGYRIRFPFLDPGLLDPRGNELPLYGQVVHPDHPGLYFVGFIQPLGAIMPLAELQARWIAGLLTGELALPSAAAMRRRIERRRAAVARRYTDSPRHTIQVDFFPYRRRLEREIRRGARRAR